MKKIRQLWTAVSAVAFLSGCTEEKPAGENRQIQINDQFVCLLDSEEQQLFAQAMGDQTMYRPADLLASREYGGVITYAFLAYSETGSYSPRKAWTILTVSEHPDGSVSSSSMREISPSSLRLIDEALYDRSWNAADKAGHFPDPEIQDSFEQALQKYPEVRMEPAALLFLEIREDGAAEYTALCRRITGEETELCIVKWENGSSADIQLFDLSYYALPPVQ